MSAFTVTTRARGFRSGRCPFCHRSLQLTFHHLIPRKVHRRPRFRRRYSRTELERGVYLCTDCHDKIHATYTEVELALEKNTPERIAADPVLARHFEWLSRQRRRLN